MMAYASLPPEYEPPALEAFRELFARVEKACAAYKAACEFLDSTFYRRRANAIKSREVTRQLMLARARRPKMIFGKTRAWAAGHIGRRPTPRNILAACIRDRRVETC